MVDLLAKRKPTGFRVDMFHEHELEKARRAVEVGVPLGTCEPVWKGDDPRWKLQPPYGFVPYVLRFGGPCVYCGFRIEPGERALYSHRIKSVAHNDCHAGFDREVPEGGVEPAAKFPGGWR